MTTALIIAAIAGGVALVVLRRRQWRIAYIRGRSDESEALLTLYSGRPSAYLDLVRGQLVENLGKRHGEAAYHKLAALIKEGAEDAD